MMSRNSICRRAHFRWIGPLCAITAFALLSVLPIGAAAQGAGDPPVLAPGLHELMLARAGEPAIIRGETQRPKKEHGTGPKGPGLRPKGCH
jgi:hypothetical protein